MSDEIILDDEIEVQSEWDTYPGELPRDYLQRISKMIIKRMILEAMDREKVPAKVRADLWERLLVRSVPQKQQTEMIPGRTDFDMMTDEEVKAFLVEHLKKLPAPEPESNPED
jgi:hypothetical protein